MNIVDPRIDPRLVPPGSRAMVIAEHQPEYADVPSVPIGPGVPCDLDVLLNTRLLVQANSGAGKSWLLRRLLEQASG